MQNSIIAHKYNRKQITINLIVFVDLEYLLYYKQ